MANKAFVGAPFITTPTTFEQTVNASIGATYVILDEDSNLIVAQNVQVNFDYTATIPPLYDAIAQQVRDSANDQAMEVIFVNDPSAAV
jgi:hypothetical protein